MPNTGTQQNPVSLLVPDPNSTPTPTPFLPLDPTPTYIPTAFPTLPPTEEASENNAGESAPAGLINIPDETITILLLGSDQRHQTGGFRTDTIILLAINPKEKTASMVSFPRDLYVYIPGWTYQRINTAMFHGGFELLAETLEYNFGVKPEHYVLTYFWAFVEVVDSLGGIDVQVDRALSDYSMGENGFYMPAGLNLMDGETALMFARSRYTTSDFDRARRQQAVIKAIVNKMMSLNLLEQADDLYEIYKDNVTTDLDWSDIAPLIPLGVHFSDPSTIKQYFVGGSEVTSWITPGGAQVLLPQKGEIIAILKQALETP